MRNNTQDDEVDLGLRLGFANHHRTVTRSIDQTGAGVNAATDIAFAASDPVSELVWSPHNGLSLKRPDPSSTTRKEKLFVLWNVGPSGVDSKENDEDVGGDGGGVNLIVSPVLLDSDRDPVGNNSMKVDEAGTSNPVLDDAEKYNSVPDKFQIADACGDYKGENSTIVDGKRDMDVDEKLSNKPNARKSFGGYRKLKINACKSDVMGLNADNFLPRASKISEDLAYSLPNIKSREEPDEEVTSGNREINEVIPKSPVPIDAIPLDKLECSAENDLAAKGCQSLGKMRHDRDAMVNGIFLNQQKGKEKVFSEADKEEDSHESVESCNNVGFFSKGVKRQNCYEETSCSGSKRAKREVHGSFTNWMSNMVKGLSFVDKEECSLPLGLALARSSDVQINSCRDSFACKRRRDEEGPTSKGFKKVFRSLYCHTKKFDVGAQKEGYYIEEPEEANVLGRKSLLENHPFDGNNSCMQIIVSNKEVDRDAPISNKPGENCEPDCVSSACEGDVGKGKALIDVVESDSLCKPCNNDAETSNPNIPATSSDGTPEKCNTRTSLWITRFCSRNVITEQQKEISKEDRVDKVADLRENDNGEASSHIKTSSKVSPLVRSQKTRSPDEMASTFMRRLDALRQSSLHTRLLCDGKENCSNYDVREENREPSRVAGGNGKTLLRSFHNLTWNVKEKSDSNRPLDANGFEKGGDLNVEIRQKDDIFKELPRSEFLAADITIAATPEMFRAISKLWLSRSDILRWMNTNVSMKYLNGFFLRLRLGKSEEGISGTGYYVACITTGDTRKHIGLKSKKSILVDVGGIKTCIESQYISNHDFLEDEIKAWWSKTVKSGGKIPSLHDLNSKFEDRKYLGF